MSDNTYSDLSDSQLLVNYRNGDAGAIEALINRYKKPLYSYLLRLLGDRDSAEDIFQDVVVKLLHGLPKYSEHGKFGSWLFGIAHNQIVDHARKKKKLQAVFLNDNENSITDLISYKEQDRPDKELEVRELNNIILQAVSKLSFEQRQVFLLREHSQLPFKEIAEVLDRPLNTVLAQMRYALLSLRKYLNEKYQGEITHVM